MARIFAPPPPGAVRNRPLFQHHPQALHPHGVTAITENNLGDADARVVPMRNQSRKEVEVAVRPSEAARIQHAFHFQWIAWSGSMSTPRALNRNGATTTVRLLRKSGHDCGVEAVYLIFCYCHRSSAIDNRNGARHLCRFSGAILRGFPVHFEQLQSCTLKRHKCALRALQPQLCPALRRSLQLQSLFGSWRKF